MFGSRLNDQRVLVVAAHPDDEVLGCGGTLHRMTSAGAEVASLILAEGITSRTDSRDVRGSDAELRALKKIALAANKAVGVTEVELCDLPDNRMDTVDLLDIIKVIERRISEFEPTLVLTHHGSDLNIDHRRVQQAVLTATRPQPNVKVAAVLYFETASSTEWQFSGSYGKFNPQLFVDISKSWEAKRTALECYHSEMREWPHSRSIKAVEHCDRWRGAMIGVEAAEAFEVGRLLVT